MRLLAALLATASVAAAQSATEKRDDKKIEWKELKAGPFKQGGKTLTGTRIKITLWNGNTIRGFVTHPDYLKQINPKAWEGKPYDFTKTEYVLLDIRLEQPQLGGYIWFKRTDIKPPILELSALDAATLERLEKERQRIEAEREKSLQDYEDWKSSREKEDEEAKKKADKEKGLEGELDSIEEKKKALDKMKEALRVFEKYPEGAVEDQQNGKAWGPDRLKAIQQKTRALVPLSAEEQDFMTSYDLWSLGKKIREEEAKKKENP